MKRYKIKYHNRDMSRLNYLIQISKSGKWYGVRIRFSGDERKYKQDKYKNDLLNGVYKTWWHKSKNGVIINFKKAKIQGIYIAFNQ